MINILYFYQLSVVDILLFVEDPLILLLDNQFGLLFFIDALLFAEKQGCDHGHLLNVLG